MSTKPVLVLLGCCLPIAVPAQPPQSQTTPTLKDRPSATRPSVPEFKRKKDEPDLQLPERPIEKPTPTESGPRILIKGFDFAGHTAFSDRGLEAIAAPYVNRAVGVAELEQLRHRLTRYYVDRGYINSGVVLPSQTFENGIVHFHIIEGILNEVKISGTEGLDPDYVSDRLMLGSGPPLNSEALEDRFRLLLRDPLIERMEGRLSPGLTPGQSILDLKVVRAKPYRFAVHFDNHLPPSTGAEEGRIDGLIRNLSGFGDVLDMSIGYSEGNFNYGGGFSIPVNRYDTLLSFRGYSSQSSIVEEPLEDLNIDSEFRSFEFSVDQPLFRSAGRSFYAGAKLAFRKNRNMRDGNSFSFSAGEDDGESKVSVLRLSQDYVESRPDQVFAARSTFNVGFNAFDATWHRDGRPDGNFFSWLGQIQYAHRLLDNGAQLLFRGDVQLSNDELLPIEQFSLGGINSVRGYRENEFVRDQGFALSIEFRYPLLAGYTSSDFPGALSVAPFMDYGGSWNVNESDDMEYLHSVGFGVIWNPIRQITAEVFYAHDLITARPKQQHDLQDSGLHFRLSIQSL